MKNNRKIEVGQVRMIKCCNELEDILYFIKRIEGNFVWIQEINSDNDEIYRWEKTSCDHDVVVM